MLVVMSPLRYAILGLLARRPRSGYQLAKVMETPIGFFWTARHSQIHPLLGELESEGLIDHTDRQGRGPHPTKTYAITERGRDDLATWAATPPTRDPARDEFVLKVYSLWLVDRTAARRLVQQHRDEHLDVLAEYERHEQELLAEDAASLSDPHSPRFASYATLQAGLGYERHRISWCDWLLVALDTPPRD